MNKELRALLNAINAKKAEVRELVASKKLEEAKAAKEELRDLQAQFDILADLEDDDAEQAQQDAEKGKGKVAGTIDAAKQQITAFVNAIKAAHKNSQFLKRTQRYLMQCQRAATRTAA